jgi:acetylornithine aminotransferase
VDIVTLGKISQVCATLYTHEYQPQPGLISQTFTGSSSSIFASLQIVNALRVAGHFGEGGRNERLFARFARGLGEISSRHPDAVSGPFGIGGMVAFTPFDGSAQKAKTMVQKLYELGLMSFVAGSHPVRVRFLMPIGAVSEEHIETACEIIERAVVELRKA